MKKLLLTVVLFTAAILCKATAYYISGTGNDANNGKSVSEAWRTIDKANSFVFAAGDVIQFQAGVTFTGTIAKENISGLTFTSYGLGKAIISSGDKDGIYLGNCSNVTIKNLTIKGAGYKAVSMNKHGLNIYMYPDVTKAYTNTTIDNIDVSGYGGYGVIFYTASTVYGFGNVRVTNSLFHDNGMGGFATLAAWDFAKKASAIVHSDVYVANCKAYYNYGVSTYTSNWSGSGILIGGTTGGLVEYCEAYENGKENGSLSNGPVGIWMTDCKSVNIQYCISHHNKGGSPKKDGGGFDIDGGCVNSVIQNCDSYENDGAGYGLFQYNTGNKWAQDTVRNCTSTNDGRNTDYGAFSFWGAGSSYKVTDAQIYGNRVSLDKDGKVLTFVGNNFSNVQIHNNAFCITAPGVFYTTLSSNVTLSNNTFPCLVLSIKTGSFNVKRIS